MPAGYAALEPQVERVEQVLGRAPEVLVPCHNDLLAANVLDDGGDLRIIDYEYSGMNEPSFELGNAAAEASLDADALAELSAAYHGRHDDALVARARALGVGRPVRLDAVGDDPGRHEQHRVRLLGVGDGEVRTRRAPGTRSAVRSAARPGGRAVTTVGDRALPERARVVVVGGGVVGASTAYHLAHLGWSDVLLLEQGTLSCGTTWHAAGLVGLLRASESGTRLVQYSADLYARLEDETGLGTGYRPCGGLIVARTEDRMTALRRTAATAAAYDLECELLTPEQAGERTRCCGPTTSSAPSGCRATAPPTPPT